LLVNGRGFDGSLSVRLRPSRLSTTMDVEDQGTEIVVSIWVLQTLATVFLALRIGCKIHSRRSLWWDDYILVLSWVCAFELRFLTSRSQLFSHLTLND
jgi:hypothetical protein